MQTLREVCRALLRRVWVAQHCLTKEEAQYLSKAQRPGETMLAVCARLAEVDVQGIIAYNHEEIRRRLDLAERLSDGAARDREKAKDA